MHRALVVLVVVGSLAGRAAGQCCGDCNGDGQVSIDELVTAVNKALDGCVAATPTEQPTETPPPTPTPTPSNRCPFTFSDTGNLCTFNGSFNRGCGAELDSLLASDGGMLIVSIDTMLDTTPVVQFAANVDSPTSASLTAWSTDGFQTARITSGVVQLTGNGSTLVIFPNDPPFMILSCNFVQYIGAYTGRVRSRASLPAAEEGVTAFARLRDWRRRPLPDLADP